MNDRASERGAAHLLGHLLLLYTERHGICGRANGSTVVLGLYRFVRTRAARESCAQSFLISDARARNRVRRARHQRSRGRRRAPRVFRVEPPTHPLTICCFFLQKRRLVIQSVGVWPRLESLSRGQQRNDRCGSHHARRCVTRRAQTPDTTTRSRLATRRRPRVRLACAAIFVG